MDEGETFESNAQAPEVVLPVDCALNDPSGFAQATAVRLTSPGDLGRNASSVQRPAVFVVILATITLHDRRFRQRSATLATNRRDGVDQRQQLRDVMTVRAGQDQRERDALRFGDELMF